MDATRLKDNSRQADAARLKDSSRQVFGIRTIDRSRVEAGHPLVIGSRLYFRVSVCLVRQSGCTGYIEGNRITAWSQDSKSWAALRDKLYSQGASRLSESLLWLDKAALQEILEDHEGGTILLEAIEGHSYGHGLFNKTTGTVFFVGPEASTSKPNSSYPEVS